MLQAFESGASKLHRASDSPLPGDRGGGQCGDSLSPAGEGSAGRRSEIAGPLPGKADFLHELWTATGCCLVAKLDRLLVRSYRDPANRKLAKHMRHERPYLFTFLPLALFDRVSAGGSF